MVRTRVHRRSCIRKLTNCILRDHDVERRFDDCDLDLRHGHAGVLAGARWDVRESAAVRSIVTKLPMLCHIHLLCPTRPGRETFG